VRKISKAIALFLALVAIGAGAIACAQIPAATLTQANTYLQNGQADQALGLLTPLPATGAGADEAQNLLCRVRFELQQWNQAVPECQQAVNLNNKSSDYFMWLGRALGQQANHASFLSAYGDAKKSLAAMQTAAQLNPQNGPALSDLGDYYAQAPSIAGGGTSKAQQVATQLDKVDAGRAAELRGDIAMAAKDYATAETQYKLAATTSSHPADKWTVLADFYRGRQRWSDLDTAIDNCVSAAARDKHPGIGLYDGAGVLISAHRNPQLAATMLENYLAGSSKSEDAPAFIAHARLGQLKQQLGDAAGARLEFAAATALAREYNPAQAAKP